MLYTHVMMSDSTTAGQFEPLPKLTNSDRIVEILKNYIASDEISIGDKLPPELSLAKSFNVSRSTIREAIRTLSVLGYIEIINGKGSFLRKKSIDLNMMHITSWFESHKMELNEFIEVRFLLEPYAVSLAIKRGTDEDLRRIDEARLHYEKEWEAGQGSRLGTLDAEFHQEIVNAAHNHVLSNMYMVVVEAFSDYRKRSFSLKKHADNAIEPHRKINTAIQNRNIEEAQKSMREHLNKVYSDMSFSEGWPIEI